MILCLSAARRSLLVVTIFVFAAALMMSSHAKYVESTNLTNAGGFADGVADSQDNCPQRSNVDQRDTDASRIAYESLSTEDQDSLLFFLESL